MRRGRLEYRRWPWAPRVVHSSDVRQLGLHWRGTLPPSVYLVVTPSVGPAFSFAMPGLGWTEYEKAFRQFASDCQLPLEEEFLVDGDMGSSAGV